MNPEMSSQHKLNTAGSVQFGTVVPKASCFQFRCVSARCETETFLSRGGVGAGRGAVLGTDSAAANLFRGTQFCLNTVCLIRCPQKLMRSRHFGGADGWDDFDFDADMVGSTTAAAVGSVQAPGRNRPRSKVLAGFAWM